MFTKKIQCQLSDWMRMPPISGPSVGASIIGTATSAITRPIRCGPGGLGHDDLRERHDHAATDALQNAEEDQLGVRRRESAQQRPEREEIQRDQEHEAWRRNGARPSR